MFQHRSSDAVITICQDNARRAIEVRELNDQAEAALGYSASALAGKPLADILPARIRELMTEYVEFQDDGNDVGNVLAKVQSFCVIEGGGKELAFRLKVLRSESLDRNAYFRLILQDKAGGRRTEAFRGILRENFKGHEVLEPHTGLPDRNSIEKDLELVLYYVNKEALKASLAVLELDDYAALTARHGEAACYGALKHIAHLARQNLRGDDTIGCISPRALGAILLDTTSESARMVLNRLRWNIAANPYLPESGEPLPLTVSIAFARLGAARKDKELLAAVEASLHAQGARSGNALAEVVE